MTTNQEHFDTIYAKHKKAVPGRKSKQSHVIATEALAPTLVEYVEYVMKGNKNDTTNTIKTSSKKTKKRGRPAKGSK